MTAWCSKCCRLKPMVTITGRRLTHNGEGVQVDSVLSCGHNAHTVTTTERLRELQR